MTSNVFRLVGYRGEHRQYYYLTPIINAEGSLVDEYNRKDTMDVNEWSEPKCDCYVEELKQSCNICGRPSVFGPRLFSVPSRGRGNQDWREDFFNRNKGSFYRIWDKDGKEVRITEQFLGARNQGTLSRVEKVSVSSSVATTCGKM